MAVVQHGLRVHGARVPRARVCPLGALTLTQTAAGRACAWLARARSGHPHATPRNRGVLPRMYRLRRDIVAVVL